MEDENGTKLVSLDGRKGQLVCVSSGSWCNHLSNLYNRALVFQDPVKWEDTLELRNVEGGPSVGNGQALLKV